MDKHASLLITAFLGGVGLGAALVLMVYDAWLASPGLIACQSLSCLAVLTSLPGLPIIIIGGLLAGGAVIALSRGLLYWLIPSHNHSVSAPSKLEENS